MPFKRNGDFRKLYDINQKRNYWVLGYFGGGSVNICDAMEVAKEYSEELKLPLKTIHIDEIFESPRYKHFKILYSLKNSQKPDVDAEQFLNVFEMLSK